MKLNFYSGNDYVSVFDDDFRENYSTDNFDKTYIYENNYISGLNADGTDYLISACASQCKRCYSSSNTDCYECKSGYSIYGKTCKVRTGYFLKTPPNNNNINYIEIKIKNDKFDLETSNPISITLFIKFFGIEHEAFKSKKEYYILICLYKDDSECKSFIGYKTEDKTFVFVVEEIEVYSVKAKSYIGVWTHLGISIHRSDNDYFPNMLNFMIDQQILIPKSELYPTQKKVEINTFNIYTAPICYYSSLKIFSTFYFGTYGHIKLLY